MLTLSFIESTLSMSVRVATPLLFAALGGLIAQRSGIYNFALEGIMLGGAFCGYYFTFLSGSPLIGALGTIAMGVLTGLLLAYIAIRFGVSQLVVCLGINTFFTGITSFFYRYFNASGGLGSLTDMIHDIDIPVLSSLPLLGKVFFGQNILVYLALLLYLAYGLFIKRTEWGLSLRAVGENPAAAQTAGIPVFRYRYVAVMVSGALAAMGGAYLTLSQISRFTENMVDGRGWIAIAAIILGKWAPGGTLTGCLLFGFATAVSNQIQTLSLGVPFQVALMVPYVFSMIALLGLGKNKVRGPAALGKPYMKNK